jgi:hypothetical protein
MRGAHHYRNQVGVTAMAATDPAEDTDRTRVLTG